MSHSDVQVFLFVYTFLSSQLTIGASTQICKFTLEYLMEPKLGFINSDTTITNNARED